MKTLDESDVNLNEIVWKLKQKFSILTDDDLLLDDDLFIMEGQKEEMLFRLQTKLCRTREEINKIIFELLNIESHIKIN